MTPQLTKRQFAEQVRGAASRQSPGFNTPLADIMLLVGQLRDEAIALDYYQVQQTDEGRQLLGELVTTFYEQPVRYDAQRRREYVALPAPVLALPGGRGVFAAFNPGNEEFPFVLVAPGSQALLGNHPAGRLQGRLGAWAEAGRREEPGRLWMKQATALLYPALTLQLVVAAAVVGDDLPFAFPTYLQNRVRAAAVAALLQQPAREDRTADAVDQA